jgi:hypothetical protein
VSRRARIPFVRFVVEVLHLELTVAWRVLLAVCIDGMQPRELEAEEREVARGLFGDVDEIDPRLRRVLIWRLGRASGKTTLAAALCIYAAWTCALPRDGHGHVPCAFAVSPTMRVAKIMVTVARELVRGTELERFVVDDTTEGFGLRRPDRRLVEVRCVAASKGGANLRGRDVIVLVLDESEFFASNADDTGEGYSVTDRDQIAAVMPRLLGFVLCISTPWPTENATAEFFDRNHRHPVDAVAALGPSMFMRPTEQLAQDIERERSRDSENAAREYECAAGTRGGSRLFDGPSIDAAIDEGRPLVVTAPPDAIAGCGGDLGLERDSSAIAVVARSAEDYSLCEFDEVRPGRETALAPSFVVRQRFAPLMRRHGVEVVTMDGHYRQSAIEHLEAEQLRFDRAPEGSGGKYDVYMHLRAILREGRVRIPAAARLVMQLRQVTQTPLPLKGVRISSPRRAGSGHGDIVSAFALACWAAREDGTPEWVRAMDALREGNGAVGTKPPLSANRLSGSSWKIWGNPPKFNSTQTATVDGRGIATRFSASAAVDRDFVRTVEEWRTAHAR